MNQDLRDDILNALQQSYKGVKTQKYLAKIECPSCGKREAFTSLDSPWTVKCGRENNCGELHHVKDLFPELFETWSERFTPKTEAERQKNPTAVADAYLRDGRGFDLMKIRGWYTQEYYHDQQLNAGSATVRFALPHGHWERLIDKPSRFGKQKARIIGDYRGEAWVPPLFTMTELVEAREIWITEGIFNTIALLQVGLVSVSSLSSANYLGEFLPRLKQACLAADKPLPLLVWALDNDRAGQKYTLKHVAKAREDGFKCAAAQAGGKRDWNDLLQLGQLNANDIERYRYYGDLLLAENAGEKALLIYNRIEKREFWFTYANKTFWWKLDQEAYDRELRVMDQDDSTLLTPKDRLKVLKNSGLLNCICSAVATPLYFQANRITDEAWYYFRIEMPDGTVHKHAFTPKQLTSASEFKNRLLAIKNAWFTGSAKQLDRLMQEQMYSLKTVETIDYVGYSREHKAYLFTDIGVCAGKAVALNEEDFFVFGKLSLKTLAQSPELAINRYLNEYNRDWAMQVSNAFGSAGVVFTAFWLGSLFAEQIRAHHKSYPFFELVGEAGAGKSTLIEFMWKCCGRTDYEGFDPSKSTNAARSRSFSQVSNLPVVLIESDREQDKSKGRQFDWDELKTAYNGRAIRSRGMKNNGNDTYEPPFRGAVVISQNAQVEASEAILSRITHITVTREQQSPQTKVAAEWLERVPVESVSGFILEAAKAEKELMALFNEQVQVYEQKLLQLPDIRMGRIAKNHAQLMALLNCLGDRGLKLLPEVILQPAREFVKEMAVARQRALSADHPLVQEFWEAFDYIEQTGTDDQGVVKPKLNHYPPESKLIAVNLKEFESWCGEFRLRPAEPRVLKQLLRTSRSRKFVEASKSIASHLKNRTIRCWIFEKE